MKGPMTLTRGLKLIGLILLLYVGLVVLFESLLGFFQPEAGMTQRITTYEVDGDPHTRVVARLESGDSLYVAANHWPRAWYRQVLDVPRMTVEYEGSRQDYRVVPVANDSAEYARVNAEHRLGLVFRFLTGFPPRRLVRLVPASPIR